MASTDPRKKAVARVYLHSKAGSLPIQTDMGFMSFDGIPTNWTIMQKSVNGVFTSNPSQSDMCDLTLVPGIDGAILTPYISNTDDNLPVYQHTSASGDTYTDYFSDNDRWGAYYDLDGSVNSLVCYDSTTTNNTVVPKTEGCANFAVRIRKYEAKSESSQDYKSGDCPFAFIIFGGVFCIFLPYAGPPTLKKRIGGRWEDVKTLRYVADVQSSTDAIDVVVMNIAGKLVITTDWFASADIYEESQPLYYGSIAAYNVFNKPFMTPQPIIVGNKGAAMQMAVRKLNFPSIGSYRLFRRILTPWLNVTPSALAIMLRQYSSVKVWNGQSGQMERQYFGGPGGSDPHVLEPYTLNGVDGFLITASVPAYGAYGHSVLYGNLLKIPPTVQSQLSASPDELTADVVHVELDRPAEEENTKVSVSMQSLYKTVENNRTKYSYSHVENLAPYMFCTVDLGFLHEDSPEYEEVLYSFSGLVKDISANSEGNCDFSVCSAVVQLQETTCYGHWGPYDGIYVIEALQNVCWECGIPDSRFLIKGYIDHGNNLPTAPGGTQQWFTADAAINDIHMSKILKVLDYGDYKNPKWKPRVGDNGWSVVQNIASYEQGLIYTDGLNVIYDPFYSNRIQMHVGRFPSTGSKGYIFTPYDYTADIVKNLTIQDITDQDTVGSSGRYDIGIKPAAQLVSDLSAKQVIAVGKRVGGGSSQVIVSTAFNPNMYPSGEVFIPFPKIATLAMPMVDNVGALNIVVNRMAERLFNVPREWAIPTYGHPQIRPRDLVTFNDKHVEGSLGTLEGAAVILVLSTKSIWDSKENVAWARTDIVGEHFAYIGGSARVVPI